MKSSKNTFSLNELYITIPSLGWMAFFFVFPAILVYSFAYKAVDDTGYFLSGWTFDTIISIFTVPIMKATFRTLFIACNTTIFCLFLAIPVSYYIATMHPKKQQVLLLSILIPLWSCFLVRIFAWKILLHPDGILKQILVFLHLIRPTTSLLYNTVAVCVVMVYSYLPFAIIPLYAASSKFNFRLFEAAMDLGATKEKAFINVFLPYLKPAILSTALLIFILAAGAYVIPDVVGGPDSEILGNVIARKIFVERNLPQASALATLLSIMIFSPAIVLSIWKNRILAKTTKTPFTSL